MHGPLLCRPYCRVLAATSESLVNGPEPLAIALRRDSMNVDLWG